LALCLLPSGRRPSAPAAVPSEMDDVSQEPVILRMYQPRDEVVQATWRCPAVRNVG
jgi:hypothetical protein